MKKLAKDLIFISQINRDGSGTSPVTQSYLDMTLENKFAKDEHFYVYRLSMSEDTYIAMGFNSFVVRLKEEVVEKQYSEKDIQEVLDGFTNEAYGGYIKTNLIGLLEKIKK